MKRNSGESIENSRKKARQDGMRKPPRYHKGTTDVPPQFRGIFDEISDKLGSIQLVDYQGSSEAPWKSDNKTKAWWLTRRAEKCREELQNECGWRDAIESKLFERFDIEVACKNCRKRLWRSEIEVDPHSSNGCSKSLKERQERREACSCDRLQREDEYSSMDPGICNLFSSRVDAEALVHKIKKKQRPDRIIGLRRTENIDHYLRSEHAQKEDTSGSLVEDEIAISLHRDDGSPQLLFPFLVLEAKSEKGPASFERMELQTGAPIISALDLQLNLLQAHGNMMGAPGSPLVWYLAYRGDDWRLYAAYHEYAEGRSTKAVLMHLWSGTITGPNESLQLILMVDRIVDWARDTYRPNIVRQLKSLAAVPFDDEATIDNDIISQNGQIENIDEADEESNDNSSIEEDESPAPLLLTAQAFSETNGRTDNLLEQQFITKHGLVKDARRIHSRLTGLRLTIDNVKPLFALLGRPQASAFARQTLSLLQHRGIVIRADTLNAMEERWVGRRDDQYTNSSGASKIHVQFQISFYINHIWEIVRELTYLAVDDAALSYLIEYAAYKRPRLIENLENMRGPSSARPEFRKQHLVHALEKVLDGSVVGDLASAICRRTYTLNLEEMPTVVCNDDCDISEAVPNPRPVFQQVDDPKTEKHGTIMQRVVRSVFDLLRQQDQHRTKPHDQLRDPLLRAFEDVSSDERDVARASDGLLQTQKAFLVYSNIPTRRRLPDSASLRNCLYIVDPPQPYMSGYVTSALVATLYRREVYTTLRRGAAPGPGSTKQWQSNRNDFLKPSSVPVDGKPLVSELQFKKEICDWIRALARPAIDEAGDLAQQLSSWYFSAGAVAALRTRHRYNLQEGTWSIRRDASEISTMLGISNGERKEDRRPPPERSDSVIYLRTEARDVVYLGTEAPKVFSSAT